MSLKLLIDGTSSLWLRLIALLVMIVGMVGIHCDESAMMRNSNTKLSVISSHKAHQNEYTSIVYSLFSSWLSLSVHVVVVKFVGVCHTATSPRSSQYK